MLSNLYKDFRKDIFLRKSSNKKLRITLQLIKITRYFHEKHHIYKLQGYLLNFEEMLQKLFNLLLSRILEIEIYGKYISKS